MLSVADASSSANTVVPREPQWDSIASDLFPGRHWACWRYELRGTKRTKRPRTPSNSAASSTDPTTWSNFTDVQDAYYSLRFDGVGVFLHEPFVAWDFDHVLDLTTGEITDSRAAAWISLLGSYYERSPSGDGIRCFTKGKLPDQDRKIGNYECYSSERFVTVTGDIFGTALPIRECQTQIDLVHSQIFAERIATRRTRSNGSCSPSFATLSLSDNELLDRARNASNGDRFGDLYDRGDISHHPSRSEADFALVGRLYFWCGPDSERIARLWRSSALRRDKLSRGDYCAKTVESVIARGGPTYTGGYNMSQARSTTNVIPLSGPTTNGQQQSQSDIPGPLPDDLPAVPVFKPEMLPEPLRSWVVDIADRASAAAEYPAVTGITALSSVIGRRLRIRPKKYDDWGVVPNTWGIAVGHPGILKSPMINEALKPIKRLEDMAREAYSAQQQTYQFEKEAIKAEREKLQRRAAAKNSTMSRERVVEELKQLEVEPPACPRYVVNDPTIEALGPILNENVAGLLLERDELIGWFKTLDRQGHENDKAFFLQCWNGYGSYTFDRIIRGTLHISATCMSIVGGMTPGPLGVYLRQVFAGEADDGIVQRFQLAVYPDCGSWTNVDRAPDDEAQRLVFDLFEKLASLEAPQRDADIPTLRFDDEAQVFFDSWRADLEARVRNRDEHPIMIAHLAKFRSLMPSLALIFHTCETDITELTGSRVSIRAARLAADWCAFLEAHARRIYYSVTASIDFAAKLIGERIKAKKLSDPFTARDIYRASWGGIGDRENVVLALEVLQDLNWVTAEAVPSTLVGGRPTVKYHINPKVWA